MDIDVNTNEFRFGTKGETLANLLQKLGDTHFTKQLIITIGEWESNREDLVQSITKIFQNNLLAIRSSALGEDSQESSMAGTFSSYTNVKADPASIIGAVDKVITSYKNTNPLNQVLIQTMIGDVVVSGVVLTRDLDTGSPYYVINYDDITGRTDSVTGGTENKCILVHHKNVSSLKSARFSKLILIIQKIEKITSTNELDIEFCITSNENIFILQARPLAAKKQWMPISQSVFDENIISLKAMAENLMKDDGDLSGTTTMFGEMPDWNPAEIIGTSPRPLSLSLYKYLITDNVWSISRAEMGYKNIGNQPLLIDFCGRPYIDVRKSFNSFLPKNTLPSFSQDLINYQLDKLAKHTDLHDKIEFEIAITCRDFNFSKRAALLIEHGFNPDDIDDFGEKLLRLTEASIYSDLDVLYEQTVKLKESRGNLENTNPIERTKFLLDSCITDGTLPFSKLARHAFIGVSFLKSSIDRNIFAHGEFDLILSGVETVATKITNAIYQMINNKLDTNTFMRTYGHLRPGTYDILSYRYDEKPELYFNKHINSSRHNDTFKITSHHKKKLQNLLDTEGFDVNSEALLDYIFKSVKLREAAKFEFTHNLSDALTCLCQWGETVGLSRDDISYLNIQHIFESPDINELRESIAKAKEQYKITRAIRLPHLIISPDDIGVIRLPLGRPTFITNKNITAPARQIGINSNENIDNHIILIESADPGFDWIFSYPIKGLITKYGGANSHMAIRCAEFGLPAAIGCGERMYNAISPSNVIELNCASHHVKRVS